MLSFKAILICAVLGTFINEIDMAYLNVDNFFNVNGNLTQITWAHAVNNATLLTQALNNNSIMMLEADVILGNLTGTNLTNVPIMGHPPATTSSLSLDTFLNTFSSNVSATRKGLKLDFKSIEAFEASMVNLAFWIPQLNCPVWLNADILNGPQLSSAPVNATRFFAYSKTFTNITLSVGWTTTYVQGVNNVSYTNASVSNMLSSIANNNVSQSITFPVRAYMAAQSLPQMQSLVNGVIGSTLTIWSSDGDPVNVTDLTNLIKTIGLNKTYIDVPDSLKNQLDLGSSASTTSILSIGVLLIVNLLISLV